ncbi:Midasin-like 7 [Homarus americanus]|uniref:Midasin-like 7 n=1 Tax=Homarus americanus TaxID=6706 RepID=A0A8J5K5H9_HOMAM|nr:Midasin-like 7 [Homarus americanus]
MVTMVVVVSATGGEDEAGAGTVEEAEKAEAAAAEGTTEEEAEADTPTTDTSGVKGEAVVVVSEGLEATETMVMDTAAGTEMVQGAATRGGICGTAAQTEGKAAHICSGRPGITSAARIEAMVLRTIAAHYFIKDWSLCSAAEPRVNMGRPLSERLRVKDGVRSPPVHKYPQRERLFDPRKAKRTKGQSGYSRGPVEWLKLDHFMKRKMEMARLEMPRPEKRESKDTEEKTPAAEGKKEAKEGEPESATAKGGSDAPPPDATQRQSSTPLPTAAVASARRGIVESTRLILPSAELRPLLAPSAGVTVHSDSATADGSKDSETDAKRKDDSKKKDESHDETNVVIPRAALKCHMCAMPKFPSTKSYLKHIEGKQHAILADCFHDRNIAVMDLLMAESKLACKWRPRKGGSKRCRKCECFMITNIQQHCQTTEHTNQWDIDQKNTEMQEQEEEEEKRKEMGLKFLYRETQYRCEICRTHLRNAPHAEYHFRSVDHYTNLCSHLAEEKASFLCVCLALEKKELERYRKRLEISPHQEQESKAKENAAGDDDDNFEDMNNMETVDEALEDVDMETHLGDETGGTGKEEKDDDVENGGGEGGDLDVSEQSMGSPLVAEIGEDLDGLPEELLHKETPQEQGKEEQHPDEEEQDGGKEHDKEQVAQEHGEEQDAKEHGEEQDAQEHGEEQDAKEHDEEQDAKEHGEEQDAKEHDEEQDAKEHDKERDEDPGGERVEEHDEPKPEEEGEAVEEKSEDAELATTAEENLGYEPANGV